LNCFLDIIFNFLFDDTITSDEKDISETSISPFLYFSFHLASLDKCRDSSVGIAPGYGVDSSGSVPGRNKFLLLSVSSRPSPGFAQPPVQFIRKMISPEIKRPGREAYHSLFSAEIKNEEAVLPLPRMSACKVKKKNETIPVTGCVGL
jgi:hypothetical protein